MRKQVTLAVLLVAATAAVAGAQTFSSGSTGADGALNITADTTVQLPPNGILNYTTVTVYGCTLTFAKNASNTPVVILATGDVQIQSGQIVVSGGGMNIDGYDDPRISGPGGFPGGGPGEPGAGPGAGTVGDATSRMAKWIGPLSLVPIIGGSGGADVGGGGGGAIVIASSGKITVNGSYILANGRGYGGSGGAIRLVANRVEVIGGSPVQALGCAACGRYEGYNGNAGLIRIEAPAGQTYLTSPSLITPAAVVTPPNAEITRGATALLSIVSVAGQAVPAGAGARTTVADILLPVTIADDVPVVVNAANIPVGTQVTLGFLTSIRATVVNATLAGTDASSAATLHLTGLNRSVGAITAFYVSATFALPSGGGGGDPAPGPDAVAQVRVIANLGQPMQYAFLRADGSEVDPARVPAELRARFTR